MSSNTEFNSICRIFLALGLSSVPPFFRKNSSYYNLFLCIPVAIQAMMVLAQMLVVYFYPDEIYHITSRVGAITDVIQVNGLLLVAIVQIVENICRSGIDRKIKESIELFDHEIFNGHICRETKICKLCKKRSLTRFCISRIIILVVCPLISDIVIIKSIDDDDKNWRQSICVREISTNMIRIGLVQAVLHFRWVRISLMTFFYSIRIHLKFMIYEIYYFFIEKGSDSSRIHPRANSQNSQLSCEESA